MDKIEEMLARAEEYANYLEDVALYDGHREPQEHNILRTMVSVYRHGMAGTVPPHWASFADKE